VGWTHHSLVMILSFMLSRAQTCLFLFLVIGSTVALKHSEHTLAFSKKSCADKVSSIQWPVIRWPALKQKQWIKQSMPLNNVDFCLPERRSLMNRDEALRHPAQWIKSGLWSGLCFLLIVCRNWRYFWGLISIQRQFASIEQKMQQRRKINFFKYLSSMN
jgi:hypothetical protein